MDPVEEFLESRLFARDFEVEGGTVRVETRIRISRNPWSFSSVVLENGVEVQEGPFAPLTDEVDTSAFDPEAIDAVRRELATQVLAIHASRCREVERALGGGKDSSRFGSKTTAVVVTMAFLAAAVGGVGYYLWQQKGSGVTDTMAPGGSEDAELAGAATPPIGEEGAAEAAGGEPAVVPEVSGPLPPAFDREQGSEARPEPIGRNSPAPTKRKSEPSTRPAPTRPTSPPESFPKTEPRGLAGQTGRVVESDADDPSARPGGTSSVAITEMRPAHYPLGSFALGSYVFGDDDAVLISAPPSHLGLSCIRTSIKDRTREGSVSFLVDRNARILVGHDPRIKKKPKWLQAFTSTGQQWKVETLGSGSEVVTYDVFARSYSAGMVSLGPNVAWTALTRKIRQTFDKDLAMYLVCVEAK